MGQHQGQDVVIKSGKYGAYIVWGTTNISLKPLLAQGGGGALKTKYTKTTANQKSEFDLTLEDIVSFIERMSGGGGGGSETSNYVQGQILRTIDENTTIRYGKYGPYIFHQTAKMSKPAFVALKGFPEKHGNYMMCDAAVLHEWIAADAAAPANPKPKFGFFKKKK